MTGARWAVVATAVVLGLVGTLVMLPRTTQWMDRGCNLPSSMWYAVTRGEPDTFTYCRDPDAPDPLTDDDQGPNTPYVPDDDKADPTTTEDPTVVAEQEREAAEAERVEAERQARVDACWAAFDAKWAAWDDGYAAWLAETDGTGLYDTYVADHPQPTEPGCG